MGEKKVDPTERPTFSRKNTNRPSRKKTKTFTPTKKYAYSSCFKQCDTMYPKKRAGCRQKCYDKNAAKRWKKSKSNKKLNPVKNPLKRKDNKKDSKEKNKENQGGKKTIKEKEESNLKSSSCAENV